MKGNRGEWSEIYTLFRLLGEGELYTADENLNKVESIYYPILKVIRDADNRSYELNDVVKIINHETKELINEISISKFLENADILLEKIKKASGSSFEFPEMEDFMNRIDCKTLKSKSEDKTDITIQIHDKITNSDPTLGFSIKSKLGGKSTLFNSNKDRTNFLYKLEGAQIPDDEIERINNLRLFRNKIKEIEKFCEINYHDMCDEMFKSNLQVIDTKMPEILGGIVLKYYKTKLSKVNELTPELSDENPCDFSSRDHNFYEYKIKRFLIDVALGMTPASIWDGDYDATGGYIIVKEDGEILCYHLFNFNEFKEYLFNNTLLDSPSSSRHKYGNIIKKEDQLFIKFNLLVRFID